MAIPIINRIGCTTRHVGSCVRGVQDFWSFRQQDPCFPWLKLGKASVFNLQPELHPVLPAAPVPIWVKLILMCPPLFVSTA